MCVGVGKCFGLDQDWTCTNLIHIGKKMYTGNRSFPELSFTISGVYKSEVLKFFKVFFWLQLHVHKMRDNPNYHGQTKQAQA